MYPGSVSITECKVTDTKTFAFREEASVSYLHYPRGGDAPCYTGHMG